MALHAKKLYQLNWLCLFTVIWFAPLVVQGGVAQGGPERNERILQLALSDGSVLSDAMIVFETPLGWFFPLEQLAEALDLAIHSSPSLSLAEGFVIEEHRLFRLDAKACIIEDASKGKRTFLSGNEKCDRVFPDEDDLYVESSLLEASLPISFQIDPYQSRVLITAHEKLPVELRREREFRARSLLRDGSHPELDIEETPGSFFGGPIVDQQFLYHRSGDDRNVRVLFQSDTALSAQLLGFEARGFLSATESGVPHWRLNLARKDADGQIGPIHATELAFLDVTSPQVPLVASAGLMRGFLVSNYPLFHVETYGDRTFQGDALPGWEVELYNNNILQGRTIVPTSGRYEFQDVPLYYGLNQIRIQLYGPQGQQKTEYTSLRVDPSIVRPDELRYRLALGDQGGLRGVMGIETSLTRGSSFSFGVTQVPLVDDGIPHRYATMGVSAFTEQVLVSGSAAFSEEGGKAVRLRSQFPFHRASFGIEGIGLSAFRSELFNARSGDLEQLNELRADFSAVLPLLRPIGSTWEVSRKGYVETKEGWTLRNRLSTNLGRVYVNHELRYERNPYMPEWGLAGRADFSTLFGSQQLKLGIEYNLDRVQFSELEVQGRFRSFTGNLQIRNYYSNIPNQFQGVLSRKFSSFSLGSSFTLDSGGAYSVGALLSFSIAPDPLRKGLRVQTEPQSEQGALTVEAFLDVDRNGSRGESEPPLRDLRFMLLQRNESYVTDESGVAFVPNVQAYIPSALVLDPGSLTNPMFRSAKKGVLLKPPAGAVSVVSWPILAFGEIDGTIEADREQGLVLERGIEVLLIGSDGKAISTTRTDRNGMYFFEKVPPGDYEVTPSFPQLNAMRLRSAPLVRKVSIPVEGEFATGNDFVLQR